MHDPSEMPPVGLFPPLKMLGGALRIHIVHSLSTERPEGDFKISVRRHFNRGEHLRWVLSLERQEKQLKTAYS